MPEKRTLVIGLGNPILGDDGVGWRIAEEVKMRTRKNPSVETDCLSLGGLSLMERLTGHTRVILIDAIFTGSKPIGSVTSLPLSGLPDLTAGHTASAHDTSLRTALNVGRSMGIPLPEDQDVTVVAVEARSVYEFSEKLTPEVAEAVPKAVEAVMALLSPVP